jgi:hypothetical protein
MNIHHGRLLAAFGPVVPVLAVLLGSCGSLTPDDLLWRTRSQFGTRDVVYPLDVRNDSIILGGNREEPAIYLLLDERTGAIKDTLESLENPKHEISISQRIGSRYNGTDWRVSVPVGEKSIIDSLVRVWEWPSASGNNLLATTLLMRRRNDRKWAEVRFSIRAMSVTDIVPYQEHYLALQYATGFGKDGYHYEVGVLDLRSVSGWRE